MEICVLTTLGAVLALLGFLILYWGSRVAGYEPFTWVGLVGSGTAHAAGAAVAGFPSHPCRLWNQGRACADAYLVARRPQPSTGLDLRASVRRRDDDGALRHPAALSRDRRRAGARCAAVVHRLRLGVGRHRHAAPDLCPRLQADVCLLDGRAHGDHPRRSRARRSRRASRCRLSDDRACDRQIVLLLRGRHHRDGRRDTRKSRPSAASFAHRRSPRSRSSPAALPSPARRPLPSSSASS